MRTKGKHLLHSSPWSLGAAVSSIGNERPAIKSAEVGKHSLFCSCSTCCQCLINLMERAQLQQDNARHSKSRKKLA